ncbi:peptidase inhibitor family I36 protein [Streptomyces sp. TRM66268-LWL]|uniref:Peptidase inhibitor family I36 protein n=1 Tax=Streptomyces polyasparticus TaxID=2767826 RepID=A0ABR7SX81_9ACTN|nr:peptidase inhibitor family I36 protein [Streptomyces polyasparticus]MBC9718868.1 peptidase inhibitor family I36 protein [Streptomyces polyasparticus]
MPSPRTALRYCAVAAAIAVVSAVPAAHANPTKQSCPNGSVCFYPRPDYQGTPQIINFSTDPGCNPTIAARSVINNDPRHSVGLYVDQECTQYLDAIDPGRSRTSLIASVVTAQ